MEFPEYLETSSFVMAAPPGGHETSPAPMEAPPRWRLTAVVMHAGKTATNGHYTARILEQRPNPHWLTADDGLVAVDDFDPAKAASKPAESGVTLLSQRAKSGGRLFASCEAYMLMYTREDVLAQAQSHEVRAPTAVAAAVEQANEAPRARHFQHQLDQQQLEARLSPRRTLLDELSPILFCPDDQAGRWIESQWLRTLLSCPIDELPGAIDNSPIACAHEVGANPQLVGTDAMKCISVNAWQYLHGLYGGGPELSLDMCSECAAVAGG